MKLTYSHKYTENTYSCGMTCTENLLNVGKRPQDSDRAGKSSQNQGGQKKKERKNEKGSRTGPATPGRSWKEINQDRRGTLCSPGGERSDQCVGIKTEKFLL